MSLSNSVISNDKSNYTLQYEANLQKIKNNIMNYKTTNIQRSSELVKSIKTKINKENLIQSLRKDLEYHVITNKNFINYKKYVDKVSGYYAKNKNDIEKYCSNLKVELKDFIGEMNAYEQHQLELIDEKDMLIKTNNAILAYKLEEQAKLKDKLSFTRSFLFSSVDTTIKSSSPADKAYFSAVFISATSPAATVVHSDSPPIP